MQKGYEPWGKVWDESKNERPLQEREERIIFWVNTETQLKTVLDSLREIQKENPELFNEQPPILTEKTDIPGVGIAEEAKKDLGDSFNSLRSALLGEAWDRLLDKVMGQNKGEVAVEEKMGRIVDKRRVDLQNLIKSGKLSMEDIIVQLRMMVRELSSKYNVSSDNFARNLDSTLTV